MIKDFKETLFMPETAFEMKANLVEKEKFFRKEWEEKNIYQKALKQNKGKSNYILHDGPPYANGSLHVGHALNKILKDFIVRFKTMNGFYSPYVPGWDTHGLPIENKMLELLKMTKDDLDKISLRKEAEKYAISQIEIQKNQFKAMSLFTDFSEIYITLTKEFEVSQLKIFKKMYFDGLIYKGLKPVFWSPTSQTALAEAEVEYEEISSPQIIVSFKALENNFSFVIMTTTPWTLPANSAIAVGENIDYEVIEVKNEKYVIASKLVNSIKELAKWDEIKIISKIKGHELKGIKYIHPLNDKIFSIVIGHHVTTETGSGLVHIAPLFGEDDFIIGKINNLEMIMHVLDDGKLNENAGIFKGMFYLDSNKEIGLNLAKKNKLLSLKFIKHSYPHDWRTHKPIIFRGTPQWFVSIQPIRKNIIEKLSKINSYPDWGIPRLVQMIENRSDWTISRQRTWGVPIIIFYDENGLEIKEEKIFDYVIDLVSKHGSNIWYEKEVDELLPKEFRNKNFTKEMDIMDVWFDSGSSSIAVQPNGIKSPFDLYLEGSDQYRGWFNSSLINSIAFKNDLPFKKIISHGFVLDEKQQKMSKSKGNIVDPFEIINKFGADILRLWVANSEYTSDISISNSIIIQNADIYRNIRTKLRFLLGNLKGWNSFMKIEKFTGFNALVDEKLKNLKFEIKKNYEEFKFSNIIKEISSFITYISSSYLDYAKDSLYADEKNNTNRLEILTNIYNIAYFLIISLAPILPTTMEEAYFHFPLENKKESVHLEIMNFENFSNETTIFEEWRSFFVIKEKIYKFIEDAKKNQNIKRSHEIHFNITNEWLNEIFENLNIKFNTQLLKYDLSKILQIGKLTFNDKQNFGIQFWKSKKCERCWNHFDKNELNENMLCFRCKKIINN